MEHYVVRARLKPGKTAEAERELSKGPPFDPGEAALSRHAAFVTSDHVYLLFEGETAHSTALRLAREHLIEVSRWQNMVSGLPSRTSEVPPEARCLYDWKASASG